MAENPKPKEKKPAASKPRRKLDIWNRLAVLVLTVFLVICISVFFVLVNIINDPEGMRFSQDGLSTLSNSRIYDSAGNLVYETGEEIREDITYEDLPQSVVDAFLSIEDSRYFSHNGFDLPRFLAAAIHNLSVGDLSQGGSTLTMQMIDNAFTKNQEEKLKSESDSGAISKFDSIKLKIQEIYLALIAEQNIDKKDIFEYYVNRIWFGSGGNTRGIQKAANYFFSKDVWDLNLGEAAFLAGAINAPNTYNPLNNLNDPSFDYLQAATNRRNTTLALMLQHGYITQEEYDLEVNTDLAFALDLQEMVTSDPNQAYINQVLDEAITLTGQDPSIIPMDIYTALNQDMQAQADGICNGTVTGDGSIVFANEGLNVGFGIIDNSTGEILAVGPGRYYHTEAVKFDLSMTRRQPGSTMKPLMAYAPAFDLLGWSTTHTVNDVAKDYFNAGFKLGNSDGRYQGAMSLQNALGISKNTTAAATMIELVNNEGYDYWIDYCKRLGYDNDVAENFNPQYVIGGSSMQATPIQQASAYSNFANQGVRKNAHRIRKVIRRSDKSVIDGNSTEYEIVSTQAAFMISTLLRKVVTSYAGNFNDVLNNPAYVVYGKSGTTEWGDSGYGYGIPNGAMRDSWSVGYTSSFTITCWSGYTKEYEALGYYLSSGVLNQRVPFFIVRYLMDFCQQYGNYHEIEEPDGVSPYNGGYIKTADLEYGDSTYIEPTVSEEDNCRNSGGKWDSEAGVCITKEEEEASQTACEGSGGKWDNGACSCPDGYELNGTACEVKVDEMTSEEECEAWGGIYGEDGYCSFGSDTDKPTTPPTTDPNNPTDPNAGGGTENASVPEGHSEGHSGGPAAVILPWIPWFKRLLS